MTIPTLTELRAWDKQDPLAPVRAAFALPDGVIYLDGNSLGPLPRATQARLATVIAQEWGTGLIRSWTDAGWMAAPARIGDKIARLVGAAPGEVIVADSTSVNLFKLAAAARALHPNRFTLLTEAGNFPTDRHVLDGLAAQTPGLRVKTVPADEMASAMDEDTAAVVLCHVHYRSGARYDMAALNAAAARCGTTIVWDLSHSTGAVPLSLAADGAEMAVGCGYKFLNGGPGSPAFLYVAAALQDHVRSPIQGWIGHASPFGFSDRYEPAPGISRFLSGTPGILGLAALEAGVDLFLSAPQAAIWAKSARLFDLFRCLAAASCPALELLTPTDPFHRGSHIAFRCPQAASVMQALIARGVIGDFRPPDVLRFGLTPLYTRYEDVWNAVEAVKQVRKEGLLF